MERIDNRQLDEIRKTKITSNISPYAEGSALIEVGGTKVLCMATVEEKDLDGGNARMAISGCHAKAMARVRMQPGRSAPLSGRHCSKVL